MRQTLGPEWIKWEGGAGIATLALEALLPVLTDTLRGRDFDTTKSPCGCCWEGETLRDCPACVIADTFGGGV